MALDLDRTGGQFKFQEIISPWKRLNPENEEDNFFALVFKITKLSLNTKIDKNCGLWSILESVKSFISRNSGLISYLKPVLESGI